MSTRSAYTSPRQNGTSSPPSSITGTSTVSPQVQRMNIVTRIAIEGKAKRDEENVAIKMYLKLAIPADNINPGTAIPLFKEENVKIRDFDIHPLDNSSVPYNFSSSTSPLLHNAARALNLPARSHHSYLSLFGHQPPIASSRFAGSTSRSKESDIPRLDERYTGHILVSGYQVSYVLPKEFPPKLHPNGIPEEGDDVLRTPVLNGSRHRRSSMADKNVILFMVGISMVVPYLSKPPRAPWLLSIPTPRCLSNHLKLHIFPPNPTPSASSSFQSLSSGDTDAESPTWDMTADPHVTRTASSRRPSAYQYQHFADDESSDSTSAPGFSDGVGIQGTFPSAERIRVRWAAPVRRVDDGTSDGRRRVGVTSARGEMACTVLGRGRPHPGGAEGVYMHLEYKGVCKGVWFPGVATLLGMDIGLETKGCEVSWAPGHEPKWDIIGGTGYTGHEIGGAQQPQRIDRQSSFDMPQLTVTSNSPSAGPSNLPPSRQNSSSSTASLLRAPLPNQNVPEYSFEESEPTTPSEAGMSSMFSATDPESRGRSRASSLAETEPDIRPPSVPITLHLNINDLLLPNKNVFTFTIAGVVLITPRSPTSTAAPQSTSPEAVASSDSEDASKELIVSLPRFRVLAADAEKIETTARNGIESKMEIMELYASADPQARRAELARGSRAKVSSDGGRIALRLPSRFASPTSYLSARREDSDSSTRPPSRPRTPTDLHRLASTSALRDTLLTSVTRPRRDGPLMIPSVAASVTPLLSATSRLPDAYAVRVALPSPADTDDEWLEFGIAQSTSPGDAKQPSHGPPRVEIASASLEGVPVKYETSAVVKPEQSAVSALALEEISGRDWINWVRVHVGTTGGNVEIVYIVKQLPQDAEPAKATKKGKQRLVEMSGLPIILPTFSLPVGTLQVDMECPSGYEIASLHSNLAHQRSSMEGRRLLHYSLPKFFYTQMNLRLTSRAERQSWLPSSVSKLFRLLAYAAPIISSAIVFLLLLGVHNDVSRVQSVLAGCYNGVPHGSGTAGWADSAPTITVTATVIDRNAGPGTEGQHRWPTSPADPTRAASVTVIDVTSPTPREKHPAKPESQPARQAPRAKEGTQLVPFGQYTFRWPRMGFNISRQKTVDAIIDGFGTVWRVVRKMYHWPLDPP
ncbi:hypothetical protein EVG20_g1125 [Dentipellis fragilis]|uniref:Uncharacterized protein n=1 Tax=Dentipellis fragilis TaxID=205917 RepID=A0A4Y9ZAR1_9AGAM|nr:hypothetical protein EVG20_g1125 [Dentipellis fragilis]